MESIQFPKLSLEDYRKVERELSKRSFKHFLKYWQFVDRERRDVLTFAQMWPGQEALRDAMMNYSWIFALKAGKLGFTELECAFDGWTAYAKPRSYVGLFSKDQTSARLLLGYVKYGLAHLPEWFDVYIPDRHEAGSDNVQQMQLKSVKNPDDVRTIRSYAVSGATAIDQTLTHAHVDEFAHMEKAEEFWGSISTVIAETCHVVTRGAGDNYAAGLYRAAEAGSTKFHAFFTPWTGRPREENWRALEAGTMTEVALSRYAPETVDDALAGENTDTFIPIERWDQLENPNLPALNPGGDDALVIALDAGVSNDTFAAVVVSRDPVNNERPAVRDVKVWFPNQFPEGRIDFDVIDNWLRWMCEGGCVAGHHVDYRERYEYCEDCRTNPTAARPHNVVQCCYDPHQLEWLAQRIRNDNVVWISPFNQNDERLIADAQLRTLIIQGKISHNGNKDLREHLKNANARVSPGEENRLRIVKSHSLAKIDAAVALSMGVHRILGLNL